MSLSNALQYETFCTPVVHHCLYPTLTWVVAIQKEVDVQAEKKRSLSCHIDVLLVFAE